MCQFEVEFSIDSKCNSSGSEHDRDLKPTRGDRLAHVEVLNDLKFWAQKFQFLHDYTKTLKQ